MKLHTPLTRSPLPLPLLFPPPPPPLTATANDRSLAGLSPISSVRGRRNCELYLSLHPRGVKLVWYCAVLCCHTSPQKNFIFIFIFKRAYFN